LKKKKIKRISQQKKTQGREGRRKYFPSDKRNVKKDNQKENLKISRLP